MGIRPPRLISASGDRGKAIKPCATRIAAPPQITIQPRVRAKKRIRLRGMVCAVESDRLVMVDVSGVFIMLSFLRCFLLHDETPVTTLRGTV
jgi:hypothetical protein